MTVLILLLTIMLSSCQRQQARDDFNGNRAAALTTTTAPIESDGPKQSQVRAIDFENFTYDWYPPEYRSSRGEQITLKDGSMDVELAPGKEPRKFFLIEVKYGDLTQDGSEEAVVILGVITSGSARQTLVFVYGMSADVAKRLAAFETGDRWDYGYHNASIKDNQLVIERYKPSIIEYDGKKHDMSASDTYIRDYYKWDKTKFIKSKNEEVPADREDKNPWVSHDKS